MLKFFKSKHNSMEKFGVLFVSLSSLLLLLTMTIVINKISSDKRDLRVRSVYTTKFAFSHSATTGDVVSIMTSTDKTKSFVLFHMDDMSLLPTDANKYRVFVTASSIKRHKQKLKSSISGTLYVFGSTGYFGLYLINNEPFPNQILDVIVRNYEDVSGISDGIAENVVAGRDSSFRKFDQMQMYFNPGADGVKVANFLDAPELDMSKMYKEAIIVPQEKTIRAKLNSDLFNMFIQQRLMANYTESLTSGQIGAALQEPITPKYIAGDILTAKSLDGKTVLEWSASYNDFIDVNTVDNKPTVYGSGAYNMYLKAEDIIPGGFDFNWQERTVEEGWLDELADGGSIESYFSKIKNELDTASNTGTNEFIMPEEWYYKDGTVFNYMQVNPDDKVGVQLATTIRNLKAAWESYYKYKLEYETIDLKNLLYLERDSKTIANTYTQNTNPDGFKTY